MTDSNGSLGIDSSGLRERLPSKPDEPQQAESAETAQEAVRALNQQEQAGDKDEKDKKTYGRTPDGKGEYFQCSPPRVHVQRGAGAGLVAISSVCLRQVAETVVPTNHLSSRSNIVLTLPLKT